MTLFGRAQESDEALEHLRDISGILSQILSELRPHYTTEQGQAISLLGDCVGALNQVVMELQSGVREIQEYRGEVSSRLETISDELRQLRMELKTSSGR